MRTHPIIKADADEPSGQLPGQLVFQFHAGISRGVFFQLGKVQFWIAYSYALPAQLFRKARIAASIANPAASKTRRGSPIENPDFSRVPR